jgi:hypothetical protein
MYNIDLGLGLYQFPTEDSTTSIENTMEGISAEEMLVKMNPVREEMEQLKERTKQVIKIWRGLRGFMTKPLSLKPQIHLSPYLLNNEHSVVVMSGVGLVVGKAAHDMLMKLPIELEWSEEYIALEDQESGLAQLFAKWAAEGEE